METEIVAKGFSVATNRKPTQEEMAEVAYEIANAIGMYLSNLGESSTQGEVTVRLAGLEATSEERDE